MSKEIPCPKCGHVWLWVDWKKEEDAVCPNGHGCARHQEEKMSDDLVKRLRDTPNWMREGFQDWKDNVRTYDRAPFEAADRIEELEAVLKKLEYWFDTDQKILDVMRNNEKADHMRKLKLIRDTLKGGNDD